MAVSITARTRAIKRQNADLRRQNNGGTTSTMLTEKQIISEVLNRMDKLRDTILREDRPLPERLAIEKKLVDIINDVKEKEQLL